MASALILQTQDNCPPGLLANWSASRGVALDVLRVDRWPELRDEYFRHYTRVVWLAQRPTEATRACAQRAADTLGLPLTEVAVGNDGLERALELLLARGCDIYPG